MKLEQLIWFCGLAAFVALILLNMSSLIEGVKYLSGNPAFPVIKGLNSPPYCIGILDSIALSLFRVITGTLLGFIAGTSTGILLSQLSYLGKRLYRIFLFFAPLAPIVWLPFGLRTFGIGNLTAILIVSAGSVFVTTIVSYYLAINCRESYLNIVRLMGATHAQVFWYVTLPSLVPMLLLLLRINFFAGWMAVLAAEMAGIDQGLGAMLMMGRSLGNLAIIVLAAILIAIFSYTLDLVISLAGFYIVRHQYGSWFFARL